MKMKIPCPPCEGAGIYQGNGETCHTCKGWGNLLVEVQGPVDSKGEVQTEDIETVYAARAKARAEMTFEEWDAEQVPKERARRWDVLLDRLAPRNEEGF